MLLVVVDTEEEFDWGAPFSRKNVRTHSILAQDAAHEIFDDFGIVPTYVVDYPVAFDDRASDYLKALSTAGRAHIGAHLQPWVNPPHSEEVNTFNSYHCNLPEELERLKLRALTDLICERFGERPTIFKGGRYAHSPRTVGLLAEFGYKVDCSVVPFTDFSRR